VNVEVYEALLMLQHRGQDSAGMVTTDGGKYHEHKGNGLVSEAFSNQALMDKMHGGPSLRNIESGGGLEGTPPYSLFCITSFLFVNSLLTECGGTSRQRRHWARSLSHRRLFIGARGTALFCELTIGHLPDTQWKPDKHRRASR
jgi:hypothetical protein